MQNSEANLLHYIGGRLAPNTSGRTQDVSIAKGAEFTMPTAK